MFILSFSIFEHNQNSLKNVFQTLLLLLRLLLILLHKVAYITDVLRLVDDTSRDIPFFIILTSP